MGIAFDVRRYRLNVGYMDSPLGDGETPERRVWPRPEERVTSPRLDIGGRGVVSGNCAECFPLT